MHSFVGQFLISMPKLHGSMFGNCVIYLWSHDDQGAQGLVVNQVHDLTLIKLLHQLDLPTQITTDAPVADGGPVEPQRGFILHTNDVRIDSSHDAGPDLTISCSREILELIASRQGPERFLVALGYAGWGPGQLEREIRDAAWLTAPCCHDTLFDLPFDQRLDNVARTLGIDLHLLAMQAGHA